MKDYLVFLKNQEPLTVRAAMVIFTTQSNAKKGIVAFKNDQGFSVAEFSKKHFVGYCEKTNLVTRESKPATTSNYSNSHSNGSNGSNGNHSVHEIAETNLANILQELQVEADFR